MMLGLLAPESHRKWLLVATLIVLIGGGVMGISR